MEYRKLGRTGLDVSVIGLGTEHLDESREVRDGVLRIAVEAGVNYVDLLYIESDYWDEFGPVFKPYREEFVVTAHWGWPSRYDLDYCQQRFEDVLAHLGNGQAEVAMMTMVDTDLKWNEWALPSIELLARYREQGRVGAIGMSSHVPLVAIEAVESGLIDVLMYPLNLTSHVCEQDRMVYQACGEQGVGLVAMKVYQGGSLFSVEGKPSGITPAQCLHYVLSLPVSTTVPGPRNVEELQGTLRYLEATDEEKDYHSLLDNLHSYVSGQGTFCDHCLPCPQDIDISRVIGLVFWAQWGLAEDNDEKAEILATYATLPVKPTDCIECGDCVERCPFGVDIIGKMRRAVEVFEAGGM